MAKAFWMDEDGGVIDVVQNHITEVINNPARFGFTREVIVSAYDRHHESLYTEGAARHELMDDAIGRGWIRFRWYPNSRWAITIAEMDQRTRAQITDWAQKMLTTGIDDLREDDPYLPIIFTALRVKHDDHDYTMKSVADGALMISG